MSNNSTVQICRLTSGDIAVGNMDEKGNLTRAMLLAIMPLPGNEKQLGVNMIPPLAPFSEKPIDKIDSSHVIMSIPADEHLVQKYIELVSGIIVPKREDTLRLIKH